MALSVSGLILAGRMSGKRSYNNIIRRLCSPCNTVILSKVIGDREIVGHGVNSTYSYLDHPSFPFPAIRFREMTPELLSLREKEKGDWRNLTLKEKKTLYRASFCQTYAEILASTGKWKSHVGFALIWISTGIWVFMAMRAMCKYQGPKVLLVLGSTELPDTFSKENQEAQLKRMITLEIDPVTGLASKWDYKNNKWK